MKTKVMVLILCLLICIQAATLCASASELGTPTYSLSSATGEPGDTVDIAVSISNNPGLAGLRVNIKYDLDMMELIAVKDTNLISGAMHGKKYDDPEGYMLCWANDLIEEDITANGQIATLTFKIKNGAKRGSYSVSASYSELLNVAMSSTEKFNNHSGSVTVTVPPCANHTWNAGNVTQAQDCEKDEITEFTCTVCGEKKTETTKKALGHSWGEWTQTKAPSCTDKGEETRVCGNDAGHKEAREVAAMGHDHVYVKKDNAAHTVSCSRCAYSADEAHTFGDWVTVKEPSCVGGERKHTCQLCGAQVTETIAATGEHVYGDWLDNGDGNHTGTCTGCGVETKTEPHTWDKVETTKEATCKEKGVKTYTCKCGATKTEEIPLSTVHTYDDKWTDSKDRKNHEQVCTVCGGAKKIEAHTIVEKIAKEATCIDQGEKTTACKKCTYKVTEVIPVDPDAHKFDDTWTDYGDGKNHERICTLCKVAHELAAHKYTAKYEDKKDGKVHIAYCVCGVSVEEKHDYHVNGEVIEKPTTSKEGKQEILCVCGAKTVKSLPKEEADLDDVPKTGDITGQLVLGGGAMIAMLACVWYLLRRKLAK